MVETHCKPAKKKYNFPKNLQQRRWNSIANYMLTVTLRINFNVWAQDN